MTCSRPLLSMEDLRCTVENQLQAHVRTGFLDREWWVRFLQIIGGTEQEARALLKGQGAKISVKQFLDFLFGPKDVRVLTAENSDNTTRTKNLREYFEKHYREGGHFCHSDYEVFGDVTIFTWMHKPTGIQVWRDAIDLTSGDGGQVFFHYTSELAFGNITHPSKEAAEIWASLRTEGPSANAWWGKGIYTVPLPPDQWESREQLLDNNFRNMMQRDRDSDDPQKGPAYVDREYPKRAAFCVPILIDPANAFDVSIRATPEMEAAGKEPGRNLANKLLNEPGKPPRSCVVLRVSGEHGVQHARAQLLNTLRQRVRLAPADLNAKQRLATTLRLRGFYQEALPVAQELVELCASTYGPESAKGLVFHSTLTAILCDMCNLREAEKIGREIFDAYLKAFGPEHELTVFSMGELAVTFSKMEGREGEAVELYREVLAFREKRLGPSHVATLRTMTNLAITLNEMDNHQEAIELHRRALEAREKTLGPEHPETLQSVSHLAVALHGRGDLSEALALQRRALEARERHLGPQHPSSQKSLERIVSILGDMINKEEAPGEIVELCCELVTSRVTTFGPEHQHAMSCIGDLALRIGNMENHRAKAVELYRQIVASQERCLGPSHVDTLRTMTNLAITLNDMDNHQEAIELHRRALEAREKTLGPEHPETLQSVSHLAVAVHGRGDLSEALALQRRALEARERHLGPQHPSTQRSLQRIENLLGDMINKELEVPGEIVELCRRLLCASL